MNTLVLMCIWSNTGLKSRTMSINRAKQVDENQSYLLYGHLIEPIEVN